MKKLVAFLVILFSMSLLQTSSSYGQCQDPQALIKGAGVIEDVITRMSGGQPLQQTDDGPHDSKGIRKNPARKPLLKPHAGAQPFIPQRAGYYDTVWPSEHTDLWR